MKRSDHDLDELLASLGRAVQPPAPANIQQNVARRIRRQAATGRSWAPDFWPRWLTNPAFAIALALSSVAIGVLASQGSFGEREASVGAGATPDPLAVFSERAPGMLNPDLGSFEWETAQNRRF